MLCAHFCKMFVLVVHSGLPELSLFSIFSAWLMEYGFSVISWGEKKEEANYRELLLFILCRNERKLIADKSMPTWSLRFAPSATLAPMQYLEIPVATIIGFLVFRDWPNGLAQIGIAITITSGLYIVFREQRQARRAPSVSWNRNSFL